MDLGPVLCSYTVEHGRRSDWLRAGAPRVVMLAAGDETEAVAAGDADGFLLTVGAADVQLVDVVAQVVDRGQVDAPGTRLERRTAFDGQDAGLLPALLSLGRWARKRRSFQVCGSISWGADAPLSSGS